MASNAALRPHAAITRARRGGGGLNVAPVNDARPMPDSIPSPSDNIMSPISRQLLKGGRKRAFFAKSGREEGAAAASGPNLRQRALRQSFLTATGGEGVTPAGASQMDVAGGEGEVAAPIAPIAAAPVAYAGPGIAVYCSPPRAGEAASAVAPAAASSSAARIAERSVAVEGGDGPGCGGGGGGGGGGGKSGILSRGILSPLSPSARKNQQARLGARGQLG